MNKRGQGRAAEMLLFCFDFKANELINLQFAVIALGHSLSHGAFDDFLSGNSKLVRRFSQFHLLSDLRVFQLDRNENAKKGTQLIDR